MVTKLQTTRITIFLLFNVALLILLYNIQVENNYLLENLCIFKLVFGKECFNCGMTRAFLSILHANLDNALYYNKNSIFIFPFTIIVYLFSWYKFISKKV